MKIRIKDNSIRYRLSQSEVRTLADMGQIEAETRFGPEDSQILRYAIETKADIEGLQADFLQQSITLYLPAQSAKNWPAEDRVGFQQEIQVTPDSTLFLLLEKDFVCLDEVAEDQSDNYPNP
ncbi:MAG: hypothetical protein ABIQ93_10570, partial [Saprospiraceae bacterium]